uniref:ATP synthase subunit a n=1 Tax=Asotana magnifica TaxID=2528170 RepID=A0A4P8DN44_9CRUS|nr:ATP synthase F0 subunit 6 [Asotana magnifica]
MMTNLFSVFDPSTSLNLSLNWMSTLLGLMILPYTYWLTNSRWHNFFSKMTNILKNELLSILHPKYNTLLIFLLSLFLFLLTNNMMGLLPFIFTATSHIMLTLSLSLTMWLGYFSFSLLNNTTNLLSHMVPQETPTLLMPFMVLIETLSNIIRPFTLAIRMSANMIAGHLLITLMSSSISIMAPFTASTIIIAQVTLMILETAVAMIQSYVFMTLCTLYIQEV